MHFCQKYFLDRCARDDRKDRSGRSRAAPPDSGEHGRAGGEQQGVAGTGIAGGMKPSCKCTRQKFPGQSSLPKHLPRSFAGLERSVEVEPVGQQAAVGEIIVVANRQQVVAHRERFDRQASHIRFGPVSAPTGRRFPDQHAIAPQGRDRIEVLAAGMGIAPDDYGREWIGQGDRDPDDRAGRRNPAFEAQGFGGGDNGEREDGKTHQCCG